jgi:hypothetical protein
LGKVLGGRLEKMPVPAIPDHFSADLFRRAIISFGEKPIFPAAYKDSASFGDVFYFSHCLFQSGSNINNLLAFRTIDVKKLPESFKLAFILPPLSRGPP